MNLNLNKLATFSLLLFCTTFAAFSQCIDGYDRATGQKCGDQINTISTALPFLRINPDGRTGGMGEVGLAVEPDAASMFHNASKLAFASHDMSASMTYTPWLKGLVDDIFLGYLTGYKRINEFQTVGLSMRYFSLGDIQFKNAQGVNTIQFKPNEFAFDFAYARKLSEQFSAGLTLKYAYSNLAQGQSGVNGEINAASTVAADLSFYYRNQLDLGGRNANLAIGAAISNIGNKVSYSEVAEKDFIPINLGIGSNLTIEFDDYNKLSIAFDINKLMVPTPDTTNVSGDPEILDFKEKNLISGMLGSFGDAPDGFSEEMREIMYSFGLEYWYNDQFAVRAGHFNEHSTKGNRKYITLGLGLKYNVFGLNFSYLLPAFTETRSHPLENTLRFSLSFDLDQD